MHEILPGGDIRLLKNIAWSVGVGVGIAPAADRIVYKSRLEFLFGERPVTETRLPFLFRTFPLRVSDRFSARSLRVPQQMVVRYKSFGCRVKCNEPGINSRGTR
jgi:hypothetical protein